MESLTKIKYRGISLTEKPIKDKENSDDSVTCYDFKGYSICVWKDESGYGKVRGGGTWFWTLTEALIYFDNK
tara:strand:+ start:1033 stop:1248 length:216 start_codon:yes stop_codon:yes gene_type:complete